MSLGVAGVTQSQGKAKVGTPEPRVLRGPLVKALGDCSWNSRHIELALNKIEGKIYEYISSEQLEAPLVKAIEERQVEIDAVLRFFSEIAANIVAGCESVFPDDGRRDYLERVYYRKFLYSNLHKMFERIRTGKNAADVEAIEAILDVLRMIANGFVEELGFIGKADKMAAMYEALADVFKKLVSYETFEGIFRHPGKVGWRALFRGAKVKEPLLYIGKIADEWPKPRFGFNWQRGLKDDYYKKQPVIRAKQ
jgi:hypothetical protein